MHSLRDHIFIGELAQAALQLTSSTNWPDVQAGYADEKIFL